MVSSSSSPSPSLLRAGGRPRSTITSGRPVVTAASRPPVLLEFSDTSLRWSCLTGDGTNGIRPKYVLPYKIFHDNQKDISSSNHNDNSGMRVSLRSTGAWYRTLSRIIQQVFHRLGSDGKERRVIVLLPPHLAVPLSLSEDKQQKDLIVPTTFKRALLQCLLHDIGAPRVCLQSSLCLVPYAFPMISTAMLLVNLGTSNLSCMISAAGHDLPFTFQTVPFLSTTKTNADNDNMMMMINDCVLALLKCLQACPRAARKEAIYNVIFCGEGVVTRPDIPLRVVQQLQNVLRKQSMTSSSSTHQEQSETVSPTEHGEEEPQDESNNKSSSYSYGIVPVNLKELHPLADHVGLIDHVVFSSTSSSQQQPPPPPPQRKPRPDLLAWTGASLWAWHWHNHANNAAQFQWIDKVE